MQQPHLRYFLSGFYSTLFSDSTILISFSLKYITKFTKAENTAVSTVLIRKLTRDTC